MEKIKTFLNNVFAALPKSKEVVDMRNSIEQGMIEHYNDLVKEGKSEAEAFGIVINEFGNIEDIRRELNVASRDDLMSSIDDIMMIDQFKIARKRKFTQFLVFGIICCVFAVFGAGAISLLFNEIWVILCFGFFGAIGAGMIVYGSIMYGGEENEITAYDMSSHERKSPSYAISAAKSGGIIFPLTVLIYLVLGFGFDLWHPGWIVFIIAPIVVNVFAAIMSK